MCVWFVLLVGLKFTTQSFGMLAFEWTFLFKNPPEIIFGFIIGKAKTINVA